MQNKNAEEPIQRDGTIQDKSLEHSKLFNKCSSIYGKVESQNADSAVKNIGSEQVNGREFSNTKMDPSWTDVVGSLGDAEDHYFREGSEGDIEGDIVLSTQRNGVE
ncbi:hypothetical protein V6N13_117407 [Hibiscus sabdariffa]